MALLIQSQERFEPSLGLALRLFSKKGRGLVEATCLVCDVGLPHQQKREQRRRQSILADVIGYPMLDSVRSAVYGE